MNLIAEKLYLVFTIGFCIGCTSNNAPPMTERNIPDTGRYVPTSARIYTTAKDTNLRLQKTAELEFKKGKQPLETELSIFINPEKTFQTMIGIGGAITDASAEVFAKLSPEK